MKILIVGGAGYLGSHAVRECLRQHHEPVVFDNFSTGNPEAVEGVEQIEGSLLDTRTVRSAFETFEFDGVLHMAGTSATELAAADLTRHFQNEVGGTLNLVQAMLEAGVQRLVYSSSVNIYGEPQEVPVSGPVTSMPSVYQALDWTLDPKAVTREESSAPRETPGATAIKS